MKLPKDELQFCGVPLIRVADELCGEGEDAAGVQRTVHAWWNEHTGVTLYYGLDNWWHLSIRGAVIGASLQRRRWLDVLKAGAKRLKQATQELAPFTL